MEQYPNPFHSTLNGKRKRLRAIVIEVKMRTKKGRTGTRER